MVNHYLQLQEYGDAIHMDYTDLCVDIASVVNISENISGLDIFELGLEYGLFFAALQADILKISQWLTSGFIFDISDDSGSAEVWNSFAGQFSAQPKQMRSHPQTDEETQQPKVFQEHDVRIKQKMETGIPKVIGIEKDNIDPLLFKDEQQVKWSTEDVVAKSKEHKYGGPVDRPNEIETAGKKLSHADNNDQNISSHRNFDNEITDKPVVDDSDRVKYRNSSAAGKQNLLKTTHAGIYRKNDQLIKDDTNIQEEVKHNEQGITRPYSLDNRNRSSITKSGKFGSLRDLAHLFERNNVVAEESIFNHTINQENWQQNTLFQRDIDISETNSNKQSHISGKFSSNDKNCDLAKKNNATLKKETTKDQIIHSDENYKMKTAGATGDESVEDNGCYNSLMTNTIQSFEYPEKNQHNARKKRNKLEYDKHDTDYQFVSKHERMSEIDHKPEEQFAKRPGDRLLSDIVDDTVLIKKLNEYNNKQTSVRTMESHSLDRIYKWQQMKNEKPVYVTQSDQVTQTTPQPENYLSRIGSGIREAYTTLRLDTSGEPLVDDITKNDTKNRESIMTTEKYGQTDRQNAFGINEMNSVEREYRSFDGSAYNQLNYFKNEKMTSDENKKKNEDGLTRLIHEEIRKRNHGASNDADTVMRNFIKELERAYRRFYGGS